MEGFTVIFDKYGRPYKDRDQDGTADDVADIDAGFNIAESGTDFDTKIFPRNMVERYITIQFLRKPLCSPGRSVKMKH